MAVTQADIDRITAAISGGEKQVVIGNQSITYRSISEMLQARDVLVKDLAAQNAQASGVGRNKVFNLVQDGRGYSRTNSAPNYSGSGDPFQPFDSSSN